MRAWKTDIAAVMSASSGTMRRIAAAAAGQNDAPRAVARTAAVTMTPAGACRVRIAAQSSAIVTTQPRSATSMTARRFHRSAIAPPGRSVAATATPSAKPTSPASAGDRVIRSTSRGKAMADT